MNISSNFNNITFGKTPVMTCKVKTKETKEKVSATLYQMDTKNKDDLSEVKNSKTGSKLYFDFENDALINGANHDYFLLKNDNTDEVVCAAETSRHFRTTSDKTNGFATVIDDIAVNKKYNNAAEPVFAHIVKTAADREDSSVVSMLNFNDLPDLKRASFKETKIGNIAVTERRYNSMLNKAEERCQTVFLA